MTRSLVLLVFFTSLLFLQNEVSAQSSEAATSVDTGDGERKPFSYLSATKDNSEKKSKKKFQLFARSGKKNKGSLSWELDQQVLEYEKRMKAVARQNKKDARLARRPQYSDPTYFGHKRKPKKRKPGKRKLCKECLIVH